MGRPRQAFRTHVPWVSLLRQARFFDETITTEILDIFRFQDSMIAEVVEFTDTALVKIQ